MRIAITVLVLLLTGGTVEAQARVESPFRTGTGAERPAYALEVKAAPSTARWALIGAAVGGGVMAFYAARTCSRNACNLSPVPYVAAGAVVGGLVGYTYADGLRRYPRRRDEG